MNFTNMNLDDYIKCIIEYKSIDDILDKCKSQSMKGYLFERCFDILNGFEFNFTRCINCHKIVGLEAKKLGTK